jgi:ethanolamine utilization microcompartment shell protein EutS
MDEEESANLLNTMQGVIFAAIEDKKIQPKWAAKIAKANIKVNIGLQLEKNTYYDLYFTMTPGEDAVVAKGSLDTFDLALKASPVDLIYFLDGTFGVVHMVTKKNEYGDTKLRIQKGIRNAMKLLFVKDLLIFKQ